jgi:hypothetical protein
MRPGWAGLLAGSEAALLSWVAVTIPAVAAFTSTAAFGYNADMTWAGAARFGSSVWVLGHFGWTLAGSPADGAVITLSPLGIALLSVLICGFLARGQSGRGPAFVAAGVGGFVLLEAAIIWIVASSAVSSAGPALVGGAGVALTGLWWGDRLGARRLRHQLARRQYLPDSVRRRRGDPPIDSVTPVGRLLVVLRGAAAIACLVLAEGAVLLVVAMFAGWTRFDELFAALGADLVGAVVLILLCLALLPNALTWAVAYLAGPGFTVGEETMFSPFGITGGLEPALPLFGWLPTTDPPAGLGLIVILPALAALLGGWWMHRHLTGTGHWWLPGVLALAAAGVAALVLTGLIVLAGGSIGPGRMASSGAAAWPLLGWLALELIAGVTLGSWLLPRPWRARPSDSQS